MNLYRIIFTNFGSTYFQKADTPEDALEAFHKDHFNYYRNFAIKVEFVEYVTEPVEYIDSL